jgi:membrane protein implicated in regulation of membrane protease activity
MRLVLWIVLAFTALFAAMNWPAFNTRQPLWLGVTTVTAPLGVLLLGALVIVALLLLVEQGASLAASRRYSREIEAQRKLAERAEVSRYTELRAHFTEELGRAEQRALDTRAALINRIDALERDLRTALEQSSTSVASFLADHEERLADRREAPASMVRR